MKKIAVFPGTFDPITKGHANIIERAIPLFDELIIAVGTNSAKQHLFDLEQRMNWIEQLYKKESKIRVQAYDGLTVNFCKQVGAKVILRGLRNTLDFEYEKAISQMNQALDNSIESYFLITDPAFSAISSTIVREVFKHKGDVSPFIPKGIQLAWKAFYIA